MEVGVGGVGVGREPCVVCRHPVFLAERLRVEGRLYHRVCFKCARCTSQLNPADCYQAQTGDYVCETCPDEMWQPPEPPPAPVPGDTAARLPEDSTGVPTSPRTRQSLVAMRRLFFDTDDAKLLKHDPHHQIVHSTSLVSNKIKDLSSNVNNNVSSVTKTNNGEKIYDTDHVNNDDFVKSTTVQTSFYSSKNSNFIDDNTRTKKEKEVEDQANIVNKTSFNVNPDNLILEKSVALPPNDNGALLNKKENFNLNDSPSIDIEAVNKDVKKTDDSILYKKDDAPSVVIDALNTEVKEQDDSLSYREENSNNLNDAPSVVTEAIKEVKEADTSILCIKDDAPSVDVVASTEEVKEQDSSLYREESSNNSNDAPSVVTEAIKGEMKEIGVSISYKKEIGDDLKNDPCIVIEAVPVLKKEEHTNKFPDSPSILVETVNADVTSIVEEEEDAQRAPVPIPRSPKKRKNVQLDDVQKSLLTPSAEDVNSEDHPASKTQQTAQVGDKTSVVRTKSIEYPDDLNPFNSDSDESVQPPEESGVHDEQPVKGSTNPFGSDSEEEDTEGLEEKEVAADNAETKRSYPVLSPGMSYTLKPTSSTNPFDSDDDDDDDKSDEAACPIPSPRKSVQSSPEPTPFPRQSLLRSSGRSITSLSSVGSSGSTPRKKRPAPLPPTGIATSSHHATPSRFHVLSPPSLRSSSSSISSIRSRKTRRAPLPPTKTQTKLKAEIEAKEDSILTDDTQPSTSVVDESLTKIVGPTQDPEEVPLENTVALEISKIDEDIKKLIIKDTNITEVTEDEKEKEMVKISGENSSEEVTSEQFETVQVNAEIKENVPENNTSLEKTEIDVTSNNTPKFDNSLESNETVEEKRITEWIDTAEKLTASNLIKKLENLNSDKEVKYETPKNNIQVIDYEKNIIDGGKDTDKVGDELRSVTDVGKSEGEKGKSGETEVLLKESIPVKKWPSSWSCGDRGLDHVLGEESLESSFLSSPSASCPDTSLETSPLEKRYKDSENMHRKISDSGSLIPDKSTYGQWKRKKAPAPPAPNPQRRPVKPMPFHSIKQELEDIEIKQQGLERQGVSLEQKIREKFDTETNISPYIEELVLQLFELVNEKNELFRKQAELMYLRRQHNLEEEHAELEYKIRCLMARPEANKTDTDKEMEEKLIQRLIEVVERRDAIVQCLEMDRLREAEEDKSINKQLNRFTQALTSEDNLDRSQTTLCKKQKKKKKDKNLSLTSSSSALDSSKTSLDLDKDLDESEKLTPESKGTTGKKKKKWYTLHHRMTKHL